MLRPYLVHAFPFVVFFSRPSPHSLAPMSHFHQAAAQQIFMDKHGGQDRWLSGNFVYFRMSRIVDIYFVGGFGTVQWITAEEYLSSRPDDIVLDKPTALLQVGAWAEVDAGLKGSRGRGTHCALKKHQHSNSALPRPQPSLRVSALPSQAALSCPLLTLPPRCPRCSIPVNTEPDPHVCQ